MVKCWPGVLAPEPTHHPSWDVARQDSGSHCSEFKYCLGHPLMWAPALTQLCFPVCKVRKASPTSWERGHCVKCTKTNPVLLRPVMPAAGSSSDSWRPAKLPLLKRPFQLLGSSWKGLSSTFNHPGHKPAPGPCPLARVYIYCSRKNCRTFLGGLSSWKSELSLSLRAASSSHLPIDA